MTELTMAEHEKWMYQALELARQAAAIDETPVGALVVRNGEIIGRGYNLRETKQDVTLHAELIAIRQACILLNSWRLDGCLLYVTLEPCIMCAGAIVQARLAQVIYGASDPKAGAAGSIADIFQIQQNHTVKVISGVLASESSSVMKQFFQDLRRRDKAAGSRGQRRERASGQSRSEQEDKRAHQT